MLVSPAREIPLRLCFWPESLPAALLHVFVIGSQLSDRFPLAPVWRLHLQD